MENNAFTVHATYTISNTGGYEIELHPSGDSARVRLVTDHILEVSDWLEIESVPDETDYFPDETTEEDYPIYHSVIDPEGVNIPLSQCMRVNYPN